VEFHIVAETGQRIGLLMSNQVRSSAVLVGLLALMACSPGPETSDHPGVTGWREFEGSWNASGNRHILSLGGERRAALLDLTGTLFLTGPSRPGVGFRGDAIAINDTATGLVGRAVWTDERGDEVFSELSGQGAAAGNKVTGTFIGGTGRYASATGTYEFTWQYVLEAEDGTVQGRAVGLHGRVLLGQPGPTPQAQGKP
jgi:hypothetical protein